MDTYTLISDRVRANALQAVRSAPNGFVVQIKEPKRSTDQNSLMWTLLTELARAQPEGRRWPVETWKAAFMHFLGHQVMFAEGLDGSGPFPIGFRSSQLTKKQMTDLIDCILSYGGQHGVTFSSPDVDC